MPVFHDSALIGAAGASGAGAGGYQISRSLRFNSSDSAYLSRTPASAGNRKTWTYSCWFKRVKSSENRLLLAKSGSAITYFMFNDLVGDALAFAHFNGSSHDFRVITSRLFRDYSAWYHLLLSVDTTQATASDRIRIYVNGTQETALHTANYPSQNTDWFINNAIAHQIGNDTGADKLDGYLADVHFIDGQALTPSSFTEVSATTGQLIPKAYTGSYGTNGFRLTFSDNSGTTATTLGKDAAGSNNWTPTNFSVSSGAGNDSLVDTPSSAGTDTGLGGQVTGNYCTWNPLDNGSVTLSNGNLDGSATVAWKSVRGTIAFPSSGKWYYEVTPSGSALLGVGIAAANKNLTDQSTGTFVTYNEDGRFYKDGSINASGKATYTSGDVIGVAFDCDTNSVTFYKNNVSQGSVTPTTGVSYFPFVQIYNSSLSANWGSRPFAYTAPSGFKALCDTNLPAPVVAKPSTVMDVKLYTGNGSTQTISGLGFSPDFVWLKNRSAGDYHRLNDIIRGANRHLFSNTTDGEVVNDANGYLSAFTSDGFSLTSGTGVNASSNSYVAWAWDAGSSTVTNNSGSITGVQVRANTSAGCSVLTYTGNNTAGATVGHGLGAAPSLIIVKKRSAADDWVVYHSSLGATKHLLLQSTAAQNTGTNRWNDTAPTNTVFSLGSSNSTNGNGSTFVAYCFAPVAGYSNFGSYVGNGSADGPFVYTGFRPRWVLFKRTDSVSSGDWVIYDTARDPYNVCQNYLLPNSSGAEAAFANVDYLSNGFKLKSTGSINTSGGTWIYAAFAENPFQYARAR